MPSDNVRNLMLGRVIKIAEQQNGGIRPDQQMVREATRLLEDKMNGGIALTDKDLRAVAINAVKSADAPKVGNNNNTNKSGSPYGYNLNLSSQQYKNNNNNNNTQQQQSSPNSSKVHRGAMSSDIFGTNNTNGGGDLLSSPKKVHHLPPLSSAAAGDVDGSRNSFATGQTPSNSNPADLSSLIVNTSKRQRRILAEREWSKMAEEDRINGRVMALKEKEEHIRTMAEQKAKLDGQKRELDDKREEERQMRERQKQQMTEHIANHKQLTQQEQQAARNKALDEKRVREDQHREAANARERARQQEYDDQVRRLMILKEQETAQRDADLNAKIRKQNEWRDVLRQNEERMRDKVLKKENERAEDREYQRKAKERQDRLEAERAAFYAQKDAKQKHHLELADRAAQQFMAKEKSHLDKIEQEYSSQLRNDQEDEANRKRLNKERLAECNNFQQRQIAEKRRIEEERKADERRQAEEVRQQILENQRQEQARKMANHQEQLRTRQFLNTQLQMAHFKETQEPETSIMRPPHVAVNMFNTAAVRGGSRLSNSPAN